MDAKPRRRHRSNTISTVKHGMMSELEKTKEAKQSTSMQKNIENQRIKEKKGRFIRVLIAGIPSMIFRKDDNEEI